MNKYKRNVSVIVEGTGMFNTEHKFTTLAAAHRYVASMCRPGLQIGSLQAWREAGLTGYGWIGLETVDGRWVELVVSTNQYVSRYDREAS